MQSSLTVLQLSFVVDIVVVERSGGGIAVGAVGEDERNVVVVVELERYGDDIHWKVAVVEKMGHWPLGHCYFSSDHCRQ